MISSTLACDALQGRRVKLSHCAGHFVLMVQHCARVHSLCRGRAGEEIRPGHTQDGG